MEMSQGEHSAYHTVGWSRDVRKFILAEPKGRRYSPREILRFGVLMRRKFGLKGRKVVPYED
jgi:hypothetical protein